MGASIQQDERISGRGVDRVRQSRRVCIVGESHNPLLVAAPFPQYRMMMTLHYASGSVLVADDVCEALLEYARALSAVQSSDVLIVPVVSDSGEPATAEFLLGPASQLFAVPVVGATESARDQSVIDDITRRTQLIRPAVAIALDETARSDRADGTDFDRADDVTEFDHDRS